MKITSKSRLLIIFLKNNSAFSLLSSNSSKVFLLLIVVETKKGVSYLTNENDCGPLAEGFSSAFFLSSSLLMFVIFFPKD